MPEILVDFPIELTPRCKVPILIMDAMSLLVQAICYPPRRVKVFFGVANKEVNAASPFFRLLVSDLSPFPGRNQRGTPLVFGWSLGSSGMATSDRGLRAFDLYPEGNSKLHASGTRGGFATLGSVQSTAVRERPFPRRRAPLRTIANDELDGFISLIAP
jgi:hypothetical protein